MKADDPTEGPICPWPSQNINQYENLLSKHQKYLKGSKILKKHGSLQHNPDVKTQNLRSLVAMKDPKRIDQLQKHQSIFKIRKRNEKINEITTGQTKEDLQRYQQRNMHKDPSVQKLLSIIEASQHGDLFMREVLNKKSINKNPSRYFGKKEPKCEGNLIQKKSQSESSLKFLPKISRSRSVLPSIKQQEKLGAAKNIRKGSEIFSNIKLRVSK